MPPRRSRSSQPGSRVIRFWWRAFAVAAVVYVGYVVWQGGAWRSAEPFAAGQCQAVDSPPGPEDIAMLPDGSGAIVSSQDRRQPDSRGQLYYYDLSAQPGRFAPLAVSEAMTFHPHGISLFKVEDGRIFVQVVNRRSDSNNTVEIFTLEGDRTAGYRLQHRGSVASTLFVHPNGIAAAGPESFYLTNDRGSGPRWMHTVENLLQLSRSTVIYHDGRGARVAAGDIAFANGIALTADGGTLLVGSTLWRMLLVYTRDPGSGTLLRAGSLALPGGVAKIHRDESGAMWTAVLPNAFATIAHMITPEKPAPSMALRITTTGGGTTAVAEAYGDPGETISAASVAAAMHNRLLIGAGSGNRIVDCTVDPAQLKPVQ
jgi:arylesterase/paraoxonase